jgi:hypothetical protein
MSRGTYSNMHTYAQAIKGIPFEQTGFIIEQTRIPLLLKRLEGIRGLGDFLCAF